MESKGNYRRDLGKKGEDIACRLLEEKGHTILERNWRSGHLEIDIISLDQDGIHFVEVKARQRNKQQKIAKAAVRFLKTGKGIPYGNLECMFDVVAVTFEDGKAKTEWFPQAYIPIYL